MPPTLALFLTLGFMGFLFRWDSRRTSHTAQDSWLPFWWLLIACSREVSEWLRIWGIPTPGASLEGGSPLDRLFYILMIVAGVRVLSRRRLQFSRLLEGNVALTAFLFYCLLSVIWSDYPIVSLKRWIKVLGHPIMALIVLTEPDPKAALFRLVERCSIVLIPVSILFIKYFPHLGRSFSEWTGAASNCGIASDKNMLGINCLLLGFALFHHMLLLGRQPSSPTRNETLRFCGFFSAMNVWLLFQADSKTPLVSLTVGLGVLLFAGLRWVQPSTITIYLASAGIAIWAVQSSFGVYEWVLALLGRDADLTDRTRIWEHVLKVEINPIFGTGFESFWLGERLKFMGTLLTNQLNQAHNGYLETYLNLGLLGLSLLFCLLLAAYRKAIRAMIVDAEWGRFRLGFLVSILLYNWTEAAFKTTHPIFFMLYVICIDYASVGAARPAGHHTASNPMTIGIVEKLPT